MASKDTDTDSPENSTTISLEDTPLRVISLDECGSINEDHSKVNIDFKRLGPAFKLKSFKPITEKDQDSGKIRIKAIDVKGTIEKGDDAHYLIKVPEKKRHIQIQVKVIRQKTQTLSVCSSDTTGIEKKISKLNQNHEQDTERISSKACEEDADKRELTPVCSDKLTGSSESAVLQTDNLQSEAISTKVRSMQGFQLLKNEEVRSKVSPLKRMKRTFPDENNDKCQNVNTCGQKYKVNDGDHKTKAIKIDNKMYLSTGKGSLNPIALPNKVDISSGKGSLNPIALPNKVDIVTKKTIRTLSSATGPNRKLKISIQQTPTIRMPRQTGTVKSSTYCTHGNACTCTHPSHYLCNIDSVYNKLDHFVGTLDSVRWKQNMVQVQDDIDSKMKNRPYYYVGSRAEGLAYATSDKDYLDEYLIPITITTDVNRNDGPNSCYLRVDEKYCCYARLIVRHPEDFPKEFKWCMKGKNGKVFVDNTLFKQRLPKTIMSRQDTESPSVEVSYKHSSADHVYCIHCDGWPSSADEWLERRRVNDWPTTDLVQQIKSQGFHIVACGYKASPDSALLWRLSFSLAERCLVWSFNHTQLKCYYLLKCVLKEILCADQSLRSYFIKMVLFWEIEETNKSFWIPQNLKICFTNCLCRLRDCVNASWLSHYFVKGFDLLANKVSKISRARILSQLNTLCEEGFTCLYRCMSLEVLRSGVRVAKTQPEHERRTDSTVIAGIFQLSGRVVASTFCQVISLGEYLEQRLDNTDVDTMNDYVSILIRQLNLYCYILLALHLSSTKITQRFTTNKTRYKLMRTIHKLLIRGLSFDTSNSKLILATFLNVIGSYSKSIQIASKVITNYRPYFLYHHQGATYCRNQIGYIQNVCNRGFTIAHKASRTFMYDVTFPVSIQHGVPEAVAIERTYSTKTLAGLDIPCILYAHFVSFLCHFATRNLIGQQKALTDILNEAQNMPCIQDIPCIPDNIWRRPAYNLAGYCLLMSGRYTDAHHMFTLSLRNDPDDNPAAMYINYMLKNKLIEDTGKYVTFRYTK